MGFERHFTRKNLEEVFSEGFKLPEDFLFGVANSGFQVEGGFNGPGEPLNNWAQLERSGKVERSGEGIRFWDEYEQDVRTASGIGLNAFRMGIEWARVQPSTLMRSGQIPPFDREAIEHYANIAACVMKAGMEPVITLHHFTHPVWAGVDFWLEDEKMPLFEKYVETIAERLNSILIEKHSLHPIKYWITLNEPNAFALGTYLVGAMPHKKWGIKWAGRAWGNMIDAHSRAYDILHGVYRDHGWDEPQVSCNTTQQSIYYLEKVMVDLLNARINGIEKGELSEYLKEGKKKWDEEISKCEHARKAPVLTVFMEKVLEKGTEFFFDLSDFENGIKAVYSSPEPKKLDFLSVDFYDPFFRNAVRLPSIEDIKERRANLHAEHWQWVLNPKALYHFLKAECINSKDLPIMILENGMAYKVRDGKVSAREDGATRDKFLQSFIFEAMRALKDGVPLKGYFYWTLTDNYEWGSYEPRFGLYTVDRSRGVVRRSVDAWGVDAGAVYSEIVHALRSGDKKRILEVFTKDYW